MIELASKTCVPCRGGVPPLKGEQLDALRRQVPEWEVVEEHHLRQHFRFKNFREALDFVNKVGELAEEQGHHPDIYFGWGWVEVLQHVSQEVICRAVSGMLEEAPDVVGGDRR